MDNTSSLKQGYQADTQEERQKKGRLNSLRGTPANFGFFLSIHWIELACEAEVRHKHRAPTHACHGE